MLNSEEPQQAGTSRHHWGQCHRISQPANNSPRHCCLLETILTSRTLNGAPGVRYLSAMCHMSDRCKSAIRAEVLPTTHTLYYSNTKPKADQLLGPGTEHQQKPDSMFQTTSVHTNTTTHTWLWAAWRKKGARTLRIDEAGDEGTADTDEPVSHMEYTEHTVRRDHHAQTERVIVQSLTHRANCQARWGCQNAGDGSRLIQLSACGGPTPSHTTACNWRHWASRPYRIYSTHNKDRR